METLDDKMIGEDFGRVQSYHMSKFRKKFVKV